MGKLKKIETPEGRLLKAIHSGNVKKVPKEEWDFSKCPADELYECYLWELSRNCDAIKEDARRLQATCREKTFDAIWKKLGSTIFQTTDISSPPNRRLPAIFYFCPEFPDRPFLCSGDLKERRRRFNLIFGTEKQASARLLDGRFDIVPYDIGQRIKNALQTNNPIYRVDSFELALLAIKWHLPDSWLKEAFAEWLIANRPKEIQQRPDRGAGVPNRKFAYRLKQISAWRLLQKMDWKTAKVCSAIFGKQKDKPLFEEQSEWNEAEEKVARWIHKLNSFHKLDSKKSF